MITITVEQLIERLHEMPMHLPVIIGERGGCHECNPDGVDFYDSCDGPNYRKQVWADGNRNPPIEAVVL